MSPIREYIYVQTLDPASFTHQFSMIGDGFEGAPPTSGGMVNEETLISIESPTKVQLCGVSFRGDTEPWTNVVVDYCEQHDLLHGIIDENGVHLSNGRFVSWSACRGFTDREV